VVVAETFSGEDRGLKRGPREMNISSVIACTPSHAWSHAEDVAGTRQDGAQEASWVRAEQPGQWMRITSTLRDGSTRD
jgi:hypothetical protein